ncbi:8831_t:CDS:2 [Cetraspora pellucida]|uniref:8831_t:CDS:1 n=1 Tax=Cetraspora pellucida TaxID=1433469 RepID=A0ACA9MUB5_9GLOM|nr:8831_t:CDS:2 [Cetraspora pellucida]
MSTESDLSEARNVQPQNHLSSNENISDTGIIEEISSAPPTYEEAVTSRDLEDNIPSTSFSSFPRSAAANLHAIEEMFSSNHSTNERHPLLNNKNNGPYNLFGRPYGGSVNQSTSSNQYMTFPLPRGSYINNYEFDYEVLQGGVVSCDSQLSRDSDSLYRFFNEHNDKPEMAIIIYGYHTRKGGNNRKNTEITDFRFTLDLTEFVTSVGEMRTYPNENRPDMSFTEVLEDYVHRDSVLKSIEMHKIVFWDYTYLTQSIISIIRDQGYQHEIRITYPQRNQLIRVQSDNALAQFSRSTLGQALCCCSCFGIIHRVVTQFYDNTYKIKFKSEFQMNISAREWFQRNKRIIVANVKWL